MTREQLTRYLDGLDRPITGDNIGQIRRDLMMPFDCEWNAWVRDETAAREKHIPEPGESSGFHEFRIKVLQNTVKSLNEQIAGLRQELATAHGVVQIRDKRIEELESCDLIRDFSEQSKELAALKKERDEQGNYWPISELLEENKELRNKLELAVSQHKCAVERADRLDRTAYQLRNERDISESKLPAKDREIQLLQAQLKDVTERNVNLRTAKVGAENELRRIKTNPFNCHIPREITALTRFADRARTMAFAQYPSLQEFWYNWDRRSREYAGNLIIGIFEFLPQLDVTTRHPSGSSEPGDRNPSGPLSGRVGNSENGQTSIASEGSTTPPVSGSPS